MKICLTMTGVIRPDIDRVFLNIKNTIKLIEDFGHSCTCNIMTYDTDKTAPLKKLIEDSGLKNINFYSMSHIEENIGSYKNSYRMFKSNEELVKKIGNDLDEFDCVIRHRIDSELLKIEIPSKIAENVWYAPYSFGGGMSNDPRKIFDNIGFSTPTVFKNVFKTDKPQWFDGLSPELVLKNSLLFNEFESRPFNFKDKLHQSNESSCMGVPQWSKRDRVFHYEDKWLSK